MSSDWNEKKAKKFRFREENGDLNGMFVLLCTASCAYAMVTNGTNGAMKGVLDSGNRAVTLVLTLLGSMTLWSGLMEVLSATGDVKRLGHALRRVLAPLFPGVRDERCWSAMGMNLAANLLGLGNAATPAGVEAARLLSAQGQGGLQALAMLLVVNNAGLQLLPTTVMGLRSAAGAANPADIWLPTLAVSAFGTAVACLLMCLVQRGGKRRG